MNVKGTIAMKRKPRGIMGRPREYPIGTKRMSTQLPPLSNAAVNELAREERRSRARMMNILITESLVAQGRLK